MITINLAWRHYNSELSDGVSFEVHPLTALEFMRWQDFVTAHAGKLGSGTKRAEFTRELIELTREILPARVRAIKGIIVREEDGTQRDIEVDELCQYEATSGFAIEMLTKAAEASRMSDADIKNSEAPPAVTGEVAQKDQEKESYSA